MSRLLDAFIDQPAQPVGKFDMELDNASSLLALGSNEAANGSKDPMSERLRDDTATPRSMHSSFAPCSENSPTTATMQERSAQSAREKILLDLWSALLNLPQDSIEPQDSFFDLGGDSITAMKLVGDIRDHGLTLSVADVFQHPSFDSMVGRIGIEDATALAESGNGATTASEDDSYERFSLLAASNVDAFLQTSIVPQVGVFRGGISDVLPATDFQSLAVAGALMESRWMLNHFYLDGEGPLNIPKLKQACFRLVQIFDILRTVFVPSGRRFLQVVLRSLRPGFHVIETDEPLGDFTTNHQLQEEGEGDVQLGESFVQFTVVKHRTSSHHRIIMRILHAQYDGVCFPKILDALQAAYRGKTVVPPPSFANYLRASAGDLTSEHYQHWKQLLAGSSMTEIVHRKGPNYRRTTATRATVSFKKAVQLPPVDSGHITTATVIKAAWAYVLAQVSASSDVVFGHTISGRNAAVKGIEHMVGPCLNLVPVRVRFDESQTARDLLGQVQDQQVANMAHEVLGFREIIRHCTSWPNWTYFSSTVQHQNVDQTKPLRLGDVEYKVGCASAAQEDFADLSVFSQPCSSSNRHQSASGEGAGDHTYEIILSFADSGAIPVEFAERALEMLCDAARLFATDPDVTIPSVSELCSKSRQVPFTEASSLAPPSATPPPDKESHQSARDLQAASDLRHLDLSHLLDISTQVSTAWSQVLALSESQSPGGTHLPINNLTLDSSFFGMGGDIIGLAQLSWLLANQMRLPARVRLEDLIEQPTVRGHIAILARGIVARPSKSPSRKVHVASLPAVQKISTADSSLANKALRLAKGLRLAKRKPRPGRPLVAT